MTWFAHAYIPRDLPAVKSWQRVTIEGLYMHPSILTLELTPSREASSSLFDALPATCCPHWKAAPVPAAQSLPSWSMSSWLPGALLYTRVVIVAMRLLNCLTPTELLGALWPIGSPLPPTLLITHETNSFCGVLTEISNICFATTLSQNYWVGSVLRQAFFGWTWSRWKKRSYHLSLSWVKVIWINQNWVRIENVSRPQPCLGLFLLLSASLPRVRSTLSWGPLCIVSSIQFQTTF